MVTDTGNITVPDNSFKWNNQTPGATKAFSFVDLHCNAILPLRPGSTNTPYIELPGLQVLTFSGHQDTYPVVSFGRKGIKGYTTGHKIWAGSIGFTMLGENPFAGVIAAYQAAIGATNKMHLMSAHDLPPFDLNVNMVNEMGESAYLIVRSIKIVDSGSSIGVNEVRFMESYSYQASNVSTIINPVREQIFSSVEDLVFPHQQGSRGVDLDPFFLPKDAI